MDESLPFDPEAAIDEYDRSKAAASLVVLQAVEQGLDAVLLCPSAVTGPFDFKASEAGRAIVYNMVPGIKFTVDGAYDFVDVRDVAHGFFWQRKRDGGVRHISWVGKTDGADSIRQAAGGWHWGIHLPGWMADLAAGVLPLFSQAPLVTPYTLGAIRSNSNISHEKATRELGYHPRPVSIAVGEAVRWWKAQKNGETNAGRAGGLTAITPD